VGLGQLELPEKAAGLKAVAGRRLIQVGLAEVAGAVQEQQKSLFSELQERA
jgi:hypothetical protein